MSEQAGKKPLGLLPSYLTCCAALCMPHRLRITVTFLINFIYNNIIETFKVIVAAINACLVQVLIFAVYFTGVGLCALLQRLSRDRFVLYEKQRTSYFRDKEPPDEDLCRFQRQY